MTIRITSKPWILSDLPSPATASLEGALSTLDAIDLALAEHAAEKPIRALQLAAAELRKVFPAVDAAFKVAARRYYDGSSGVQLASKSAGGNPALANLAEKFWSQVVAEVAEERAKTFDAILTRWAQTTLMLRGDFGSEWGLRSSCRANLTSQS